MWKSAKTKRFGIILTAAGYAAWLIVGAAYLHPPAQVRAANLIPISTCQELQAMDQNLDGDYVLAGNIDCSGSGGWNSGIGFVPIGLAKDGAPFTGTLDGQGYTISGLTINFGITTHDAGLFFIIKNSTIQSVYFAGSAVTGHANAGTLAAAAADSNISYVRVDGGTVTAADGSSTTTGGLVGYYTANEGGHTMSHSYFGGNVNGHARTGGLVGLASSTEINTSYSTGNVSGSSGVGGLAGQTTSGAVLSSDYSHSAVSASGDNAGGLVGLHGDDTHAAPTISDSYASGAVRSDADNTGGLVGTMRGDIQRSFAAGSVGAPNATHAGGLAGRYTAGSSNQNAYDQLRSGQASCAGGGACSSVMSGVSTVNTPASANSSYFFDSLANTPLQNWDTTRWFPKANDFPALSRSPHNIGEATIVASGTSLQISWPAADSSDTPDTISYMLQYRAAGSSGNWTTADGIPAGTGNSYTISGLTPNTPYTIIIFTKNATGHSSGLAITAQTTAASAAPKSTLYAHGTVKTIPSPPAPPAPAPKPPTPAPATITIGYQGDFLRGGHTVDNLHMGDVVNFRVIRGGVHEVHTATIKEIGVDYVLLTIASDPFDVRLGVGNSKDISVHQDKHTDLRITLAGVAGNAAKITFRALAPGTTGAAKATATPAANTHRQAHAWAWLLAVIPFCIVAAIAIRALRRHTHAGTLTQTWNELLLPEPTPPGTSDTLDTSSKKSRKASKNRKYS